MGRLFWKFFFFLMLAQVTTVVGVSSAIWVRNRNVSPPPDFALGLSAARLLDRAATTLERAGEPALRRLLEGWSREPIATVYVTDSSGREILDRPMPPRFANAVSVFGELTGPSIVRRVVLADARSYVLFVDDPGAGSAGIPGGLGLGGPGAAELRFPVEPIAGGLLASLIVAALLAWYVSKPIRNLRRAFDAAAHGDLDVRIGASTGRRRDELADLAGDFDRTAERLKLLMDGQRRLLHDVSHELRSPLARLQAAVGLARQQPSHIEASMDRIERESVRIDKLIDELLTLSRVEAGMAPDSSQDVDLFELVDEVVRDAKFEADARSAPVRFETRIDALNAVKLRGNAEMLHRALDNVVRNAARYSPPGGRVQVFGDYDSAKRMVQLTIADEGPGVSTADLGSIFQPFFRGAQAKTSQGHGLGLAIACRVVEAHGGSIEASNRASGGLAVAIRLPA